MDYIEQLRRLSLNDTRFARDTQGSVAVGSLEPKTVALVRLAALVSIGGALPTYGTHIDAALDAGATVDEIVGVLVVIMPLVGAPRVVAAAPTLAMALGHDVEDALEP